MRWLYLINSLKSALLHKKNKIIIRNKKNYLQLLTCLIKINFIKTFSVKNKLIYIEFSCINNKQLFTNLTNFYNLRNKKIFRLNFLKKFHYTANSSVYILSTSKGFMGHSEAINLKLGGLIFFKITR